MPLVSDNPLNGDRKSDRFNLDVRLRMLTDSLLDIHLPTPVSVLISGGWGTGKTTAMQHLQALLTSSTEVLDVKSCWFFPWKYQSQDDVWRGLISEVLLLRLSDEKIQSREALDLLLLYSNFLGSNFLDAAFRKAALADLKTAVEQALPHLKRVGTAGIGAIQLILPKIKMNGVEVSVDANAVERLCDSYIFNYKRYPKFLNEHERAFKTELESWLGPGKNKRLILFIDDLDRCLPDVALQVLESLKLYLNTPNLVFVVGVDKHIVEKIVHKRYCDQLGHDFENVDTAAMASRYLDKMFQVEVDIQPSDELVNSFRRILMSMPQIRAIWGEVSSQNKKYFQNVFDYQSGLTPRSVIRTLNTALIKLNPGYSTPNQITKELWVSCLEMVLRDYSGLTLDQREAMRHDSGRQFFREWRLLVNNNQHQQSRRNYLTKGMLETLLDGASVPSESLMSNIELSLTSNSELHNDIRDMYTPLLNARYSRYHELLLIEPLGTLAAVQFDEEQLDSKSIDNLFREVVASRVGIPLPDVTNDYLQSLEALDLSFSELAQLPSEPKLSSIRELRADFTQISDLAAISEWTSLSIVSLKNTKVSDLNALTPLNHLKQVYLKDCPVVSIDPLASLSELRVLDLSRTRVESIAVLKKLARLQQLSLERTEVTSLDDLVKCEKLLLLNISRLSVRDIKPLGELNRLEVLWMNGSKVNNLAALEGLRSLRELSVAGTRIAELRYLMDLHELEKIDVSRNEISSLVDLGRLRKLRSLDVSYTKVRDLSPLQHVSSLRHVCVTGCGVSESAISQLKKALPNVEIVDEDKKQSWSRPGN